MYISLKGPIHLYTINLAIMKLLIVFSIVLNVYNVTVLFLVSLPMLV